MTDFPIIEVELLLAQVREPDHKGEFDDALYILGWGRKKGWEYAVYVDWESGEGWFLGTPDPAPIEFQDLLAKFSDPAWRRKHNLTRPNECLTTIHLKESC